MKGFLAVFYTISAFAFAIAGDPKGRIKLDGGKLYRNCFSIEQKRSFVENRSSPNSKSTVEGNRHASSQRHG